MEYFSPAEDRLFEVARGLMEEYVRGRDGYEAKVLFDLFASGGSHMRMQLTAVPRSEAVPKICYRQWMADTYGFGRCVLTVAEDATLQWKLDFHEPAEALDQLLRGWFRQTLP